MKTLQLGSITLTIKDYRCAGDGGVYMQQASPQLWLYVNITDGCLGTCPFCVNPCRGLVGSNPFDPTKFSKTLQRIQPLINGISITCGEPALDTSLLRETLRIIDTQFPDTLQVDAVTSGIQLQA